MARTYERKSYQQEVPKKKGSSPTTVEYEWVIPTGKTLALGRFSGGIEYSTKEVRIEIIYRTGSGDEVIAVGYAQSFQLLIEADYQGDGTSKIVVRMVNGDSSPLNMTAWWEGISNG